MTIEKTEAAAALDDIARVVAGLKQSRIYRTASALLILWGLVVAAGYLANTVWPRAAGAIWFVLQAAATVATLALSVGWNIGGRRGVEWRFGAGMVLVFGFGLIWSVLLGHMGPRELNAFWATLFMFCYTVAGLWFGRAFMAFGLGITALTVAGYLWAGPWFEPYMALVDGGGLVLCGLWMRRA